MNDETTVHFDLIDLLGRPLNKWKQILVWMLCFAVLLGGYSYANKIKQYNQSLASSSEETASDEDFTFTSLTKAEADALIYDISGYQASIDEDKRYLQESLLMNQPYDNAQSYVLRFLLGVDDSSKYDVIQEAYRYTIVSGAVYQKIAEVIAPKYQLDPSYISELISISSFDIGKGLDDVQNEVSLSVETVQSGAETHMFSVTIFGLDEEESEKAAEVIDDAITAAYPRISEVGGHTMIISTSEYSHSIRKDWKEKKQAIYKNIFTLQNEITASIKNLTDEENAYIKMKVSGLEHDSSINSTKASADQVKKPSLSPLKFVLGALIGLLLAFAWYCIPYFLSGRIHTVEDVESNFKQGLLVVVSAPDSSERFGDRLTTWVHRKLGSKNAELPPQSALQILKTRVLLNSEKLQNKKIGIVGVVEDAAAKSLCKDMASSFNDTEIKAVAIENLLTDPSSMKAVADADALILVEELQDTRVSDIEQTLLYCEAQRIKVLGHVVIAAH